MTVIAKWAGTGLSAGTTLTTSTAGTGDTAFTALSGAAPVTASGGIGPSGIRLNWSPTSAASYVDWGAAVAGTLTAMAVRVYYRFSAWPTSSFTILRALAGSTQQWGVDLGGTGSPGQIRLRNAGNTASTATSATNVIATGTDVRIEAVWDSSGATSVYAYSGHSSVALATLTGNTGGTSPVNTMRWGPVSGPTVAQYYSSDYALGNAAALIGPSQTPSSTLYVWNGTALTSATLRGVWDGSTLQPATIRT